jgi:hypothetical protein
MNQREFASVLFAVVGVFVAATRLPELMIHVGVLVQSSSEIESPFRGISQRGMSTIGLIASLVGVLLGTALILLRGRLAQRLFAAATPPLEAREAQAVALSVLGCYFVVEGVSRFGWAARFDWAAAIQVALGLTLFFGASRLSGFWSLARSAGRPRASSERAV